MDQIVAIFGQLGVDKTIVFQLALFIVLYFGFKTILLNKLYFVITQREKKTVLLEKEADITLKKSDEMLEDFRVKIEEAHRNANEMLRIKKDQMQKGLRKKFEEERKVLTESYSVKKVELEKDIEIARKSAFSDADQLSEMLVKKLS
jgi:F0F1-type ATP synthase membrane subunit b/b'